MPLAPLVLLFVVSHASWADDESPADPFEVCLSDGQVLRGRAFVQHEGHSHLLVGGASLRIPDESKVAPCVELYEGLSWPAEDLVKYRLSGNQVLIGVPIESSNGTLTVGLLDRHRVYLPDSSASSASPGDDPSWLTPSALANPSDPGVSSAGSNGSTKVRPGVVVAIVVPVVLVGVAVGVGAAVANLEW